MKILSVNKALLMTVLLSATLLMSSQLEAQRLRHRPAGGGVSRNISQPSQKARTGNARINNIGSRQKATDRKPISGQNREIARPSTGNRKTSNVKSRTPNRTVNRTTNNRTVNRNTVNVNRNVNVRVNNRNTIVVAGRRPYVRPPYAYGGFFYYSHYPYFYHPYVYYSWGPYYHPWGFFAATLATTAIVVAILDDNGNQQETEEEYHYENGTYYLKTEEGFVAVQAPVGAQVPEIPKESVEVEIAEKESNYYYAGAFYAENEDGYIVVPATAGTIVPNLPEGGEEVKIGEQTYVQFGETYYLPIQVDGKNMYEIAEVTPAD
ncbi:MAG: DUF6515 family protein [Bacteroidota bacterium]